MTDSKPISSPCILVCAVDPKTGWCQGCFRTLKEIAGWTRMAPEEREHVMRLLPERRAAAGAQGDDASGGGP